MHRSGVRTSLIILSVLWQASAAPAAPPPPLAPTGSWLLDYDETQCLASRQYGTGKTGLTFAIRPAPNGDSYELLVGRPRYGPKFAEELDGSVDFGRGPIKAWLMHYGDTKNKVAVDRFRISAADMAQARTANSIYVRTGGGLSANFALTNMPDLMKGLEDCTKDLKRYWNVDDPEKQNVAVGAKGDVRSVFRATDYPSEALKRRQEGGAQFLLLINEQGKVAGCNVLQASGIPSLDGMACQVITERAKFQAALDKQGKPIRSAYVTPMVIWQLGH